VIPVSNFRLESVDVLRGVAMILVALDHTRDFVAVPGVSPTNLAQTTMPLFFTRWNTFLRAGILFAYGNWSKSVAAQKNQAPVVAISIYTRLVVDLFGTNAVSLFGIAVQFRLPRDTPECALGTWMGDDRPLGARPCAFVVNCRVRRRNNCGTQCI
jgi:uncharacterized membrane protein